MLKMYIHWNIQSSYDFSYEFFNSVGPELLYFLIFIYLIIYFGCTKIWVSVVAYGI